MPEHPEVRQMVNMINKNFSNVNFQCFQQKYGQQRGEKINLSSNFNLFAEQRGKQLKLNIQYIEDKISSSSNQNSYFGSFISSSAKQDTSIIIGFGLLGYFTIDTVQSENFIISFKSNEIALNLVSQSPETIYYHQGEFDMKRGPDPIISQAEFTKLALKTNFQQKPLLSILMDQRFFNGVGNYLRSEIIHRSKLHPYSKMSYLDSSFVELLIQVLQEAYSYVNDVQKFNKWLQCYGKATNSVKDSNNRTLWTYLPIKQKQTISIDRKDKKDIDKFLTIMQIK